MGTRHLIAVIQNEEPKVAQYGQWDGYPRGQGIQILKFLSRNNERYSIKDKQNIGQKNNTDLKIFRDKIAKTIFLPEKELTKRWREFDPEGKEWVSVEVSNKFLKKYPELHRDSGSDILQLIYEGKAYELNNSFDFADNSGYCEWAYVIDLDKDTFEIFKGYVKEPLNENERFYNNGAINANAIGTKYYPVKHIHTFDLNNLPSENEFLNILQG